MCDCPSFCPACGRNLQADRRVIIGPLEHDPRGASFWGSTLLRLTADETMILGTLVIAGGAIVRRDVLAERVGTEALGNVIEVQVSRLRRKLRDAGAPDGTIVTEIRRGYRIDVGLIDPSSAEAGRCR